MNALRGALSVMIIEAVFFIYPQNHDPAFSALPFGLQLFTVLALVLAMGAGIIMFIWGVVDQHGSISPANPAE
jgi:hypothetical protein